MIHVLVTGANGFLGRNLTARLTALSGIEVYGVDVDTSEAERNKALQRCNVIFHLAGVNRSNDPEDFPKTNRGLTAELCEVLRRLRRTPKIVFSSSIQATLDNPYGISKREAEQVLLQFGTDTGAPVRIYRLKNVFGKWSRPNYNSVVATFCHNIANDLPIQISDPNHPLDLVYIDDVVDVFVREVSQRSPEESGRVDCTRIPSYTLTLGELAGTLQRFREIRETLLMPDFALPFHRQLYATYLSYVPDAARETRLRVKRDNRGSLAEFVRSRAVGQLFLSRTLPGVVRGNHYHHTKTEKFFVVEGDGLLRMRKIFSHDVVEYRLRGSDYQVVDIPPGYTHSIQNVGTGEMVTLFWASEIFDPERPDTFYLPVDEEAQGAQAEAL
jgi:UDP-2-acetamido-2,6-beta-L-arabino-hexul-4-ose reductase